MFVDFMKTSTIDYPNRVATVGFFSGCNLMCPYCHNHPLINTADDLVDKKDEFYEHLEKRKHVLDGIVFTGGEPLIGSNFKILMEMIKTIKEDMSPRMAIKLDTNGLNPDRLKEVLDTGYIDMVAIDVKTSVEIYRNIFKAPMVNPIQVSHALKKSLIMISSNPNVRTQIRTTCVKEFAAKEILEPFIKQLKGFGVSFDSWRLNRPNLDSVLSPEIDMTPMTDVEMRALSTAIIKNQLASTVTHGM